MERYNSLTTHQKQILNRLYVYLGFNEILSFSQYIDFMFYNAKSGLSFECIINHTLAHIVIKMKQLLPEYFDYIKHIWLEESDMLEHMNVGSHIEYDPKGVLRFFIKTNYDMLIETKL